MKKKERVAPFIDRVGEYFELCDLERAWQTDQATPLYLGGVDYTFYTLDEVIARRKSHENALRGFVHVMRFGG